MVFLVHVVWIFLLFLLSFLAFPFSCLDCVLSLLLGIVVFPSSHLMSIFYCLLLFRLLTALYICFSNGRESFPVRLQFFRGKDRGPYLLQRATNDPFPTYALGLDGLSPPSSLQPTYH